MNYILIGDESTTSFQNFGGAETILAKKLKQIQAIITINHNDSIFFVLKKFRQLWSKPEISLDKKSILLIYLKPSHLITVFIIAWCHGITVTRVSYGLPESEGFRQRALKILYIAFRKHIRIETINLKEFRYFNRLSFNVKYEFPASRLLNLVSPKNEYRKLSRFGFVGRWDEKKGASAFQDLCCNHREALNASIWVLTYGIPQEARRQLELANVVVYDFHGAERGCEFNELLSQLDFLVFPFQSLIGTTNPPLLPIECLSVGIPILVNPLGDLHELLGEVRYPHCLKSDFDEADLLYHCIQLIDIPHDRATQVEFKEYYQKMEEKFS